LQDVLGGEPSLSENVWHKFSVSMCAQILSWI
jgi:hypothetical protein